METEKGGEKIWVEEDLTWEERREDEANSKKTGGEREKVRVAQEGV